MELNDLLERSASSLLVMQRQDGSFPEGHNGPYYDDELPIRNTGHVMAMMFRVHELTGDSIYRATALKALSYLTDPERRPMGATFWVRKNPSKDFSNGLIGQAWAIEALCCAAFTLGDESLATLAEEIFLLHPFDENLARWQVVNVDGSYDSVDMTFNHQLWFAAAGGLLIGNEQIKTQVVRFLDKIDINLEIYGNGLIVHALGGHQYSSLPVKRRIKRFIKDKVRKPQQPFKDTVLNKAIGYHAFNTYAFALLNKTCPEHIFWNSDKFASILDFILEDEFRDGLGHFIADTSHQGQNLPFNRFGYPYNPPGIEVAFTMQTFNDHYSSSSQELIPLWLGMQLDKTYDLDAGLMRMNTDDPATLASRMYEATRLSNYEIKSIGQ